MRHILTLVIAFHWMAVFALLAIVSTLNPEHGILATLSFLGVAPTPDADLSGGGPMAAGFFSFAFTVAGVLFLWTLATAFFRNAMPSDTADHIGRLAFGAGICAFSLLLLGGALFPVSGLFPVSAIAVAALLASYLAIFAERWSISLLSARLASDFRAPARLMAAGAAHTALLERISGRTGMEAMR